MRWNQKSPQPTKLHTVAVEKLSPLLEPRKLLDVECSSGMMASSTSLLEDMQA